jgi:polysaccharide deacetylase 2 family uncharacterized protein YibQ
MLGRPTWRLPAALAAGLLLATALVYAAAAILVADAPPLYRDLPRVDAALPPAGPRPVGPSHGGAIGEPWIGVVVVGLGLAGGPTRAAIDLPPAIGLAFSPYAADAPEWQRQARAAGHEVLIELPLEPLDPALTDAGARALAVADGPSAHAEGLAWVLAQGQEPVGLVAEAGRFALRPEAFLPVAQAIGAHGLGLVEIGARHLEPVALAAGAHFAGAERRLDTELTAEAIDTALAALEAEARGVGHALAFARPHHLVLTRLAAWAERIGDARPSLAPPSQALRRAAAQHTSHP